MKKIKDYAGQITRVVNILVTSSENTQMPVNLSPEYINSWWKEGLLIRIPSSEIEPYENLFELFGKCKEGKNISTNEFEEIIVDKTFEGIKSKKTNLICKKILCDVEALAEKRTVLIPLFNISMEKDKLSICEILIFKTNNEECDKYKLEGKNYILNIQGKENPSVSIAIMSDAPTLESSSKIHGKMLVTLSLGSLCARVDTISSPKKARENAIRKLSTAIGYIWLFIPLSKINRTFIDKIRFGSHTEKGPIVNVIPVYSYHHENIDNCNYEFENKINYALKIDEQTYDLLTSADIRKYENYIFNNDFEINDRIKNCLFWYAQAKQSNTEINQIVFYSLSFESLISPTDPSVGIRSFTAEVSAFLLADNSTERVFLYKTITKLYDKRSKIMHGKEAFITNSDIKMFSNIIRALIFNFVDRKFTSIEDAYNLANQIKFS